MYFPQIKTTPAELKALEELKDSSWNKVVPILQLTKPKLSNKIDSSESLVKHVKNIFEKIGSRKLFLGVTEDDTYQDASLSQFIHDSSDGYRHWREFVDNVRREYNNQIIPCVVGKATKSTIEPLKQQINFFLNDYECLVLRLPVYFADSLENITTILEILDIIASIDRFVVVYDFGYINDNISKVKMENLLKEISSLHLTKGWNNKNICLFSSCPQSFPIHSRVENSLEQIDIYEYDLLKFVQKMPNFDYGDYAYIHPKRAEGGGFWLPRIDFPSLSDNKCYYIRAFNREMKRDEGGNVRIKTLVSNEDAYKAISTEMLKQKFFIHNSLTSWGKEQIQSNVLDKINGKSPQHYISIRSSIHLENICSLLA